MVAVPAATAFIFPVESTVTTLVSLDFQVTFLFVAVDGFTVFESFTVLPFFKVSDVMLRETLVAFTTAFVTVTVQVAFFLLPSFVVQVMVAFPTPTAVTFPLESTFATLVLLDFQVTFLFVVVTGFTVFVSVDVLPTVSDNVVLFSETPVAFITGTVTLQVAFLPLPSFALHVMVAVPVPTAVTFPLESTVATLLSLEVQLTFLLVAVDGFTVFVSVKEFPFISDNAVTFRLTLVTGFVTVTLHVAFLPLPSFALHVMVAVPAPTAVTVPDEFTVATLLSLDVQLTLLFVAVVGFTVFVSFSVPPTLSANVDLFRVTLVTLTVVTATSFTVTLALALYVPADVVAVIVAVPAPFAVTTPLLSTVATLVFELFHFKELLFKFAVLHELFQYALTVVLFPASRVDEERDILNGAVDEIISESNVTDAEVVLFEVVDITASDVSVPKH
jgi:hypothetical protein